jgi:hypothetical protein
VSAEARPNGWAVGIAQPLGFEGLRAEGTDLCDGADELPHVFRVRCHVDGNRIAHVRDGTRSSQGEAPCRFVVKGRATVNKLKVLCFQQYVHRPALNPRGGTGIAECQSRRAPPAQAGQWINGPDVC